MLTGLLLDVAASIFDELTTEVTFSIVQISKKDIY